MVSGGDRSGTMVGYEVWSQVLEGLWVATCQEYQGRCSATADCSFQPQMLGSLIGCRQARGMMIWIWIFKTENWKKGGSQHGLPQNGGVEMGKGSYR